VLFYGEGLGCGLTLFDGVGCLVESGEVAVGLMCTTSEVFVGLLCEG
jgi:hypothetical protein